MVRVWLRGLVRVRVVVRVWLRGLDRVVVRVWVRGLVRVWVRGLSQYSARATGTYWGAQPHFSPRHTEIWIWGWAKMGKKSIWKERETNFLFSK